jgi:ABC-type lipoprotein release transport system permease subunit
MRKTTPANGSAPTHRLRPWRSRLILRRSGVQSRLVLVVATIAVLASTLISSLALLVVATEREAVRGALGAAAPTETELRVTLVRPNVPLGTARNAMQQAMQTTLGDAAASRSYALTLSDLYFVPATGISDLVYLGELESVRDNTTLSDGEWPDSAGEVAIPDVGAQALGVGVGDSIRMVATTDQPDDTVTISGIYSITDHASTFWAGDLLFGAGHDPAYPVPGSAGAVVTDAVGPLIVADGTFAAQAMPAERLVLRVVPDFEATTVEQLAPLQARLDGVRETAPRAIGDIGLAVKLTTRLDALVTSVSDLLAVTRSTVVAVSLLLFLLAMAALGQAARLLTEARVAERHLMRARGASNRQVLGVAAAEAALIVAVTAVVSPMLARAIYLLVSQQPAMVAAGMAVDPGIPPLVWVVAAVVSVLFWLLLVAPLLGRENSFHEGEQDKARQRRFSGLQRSGVDVAVLVLAVVAYVQLRTYQGPSSGSALWVDPVLVIGPAVVMLAGAFLAVRLVPIAGRLTDRFAERSRGSVLSLAAWEIGRRAQRATAAILLITIALAAGSFSLSFLATWRQSQVDQSAFALGAPLRLTSDQAWPAVPDAAQPVMRFDGFIAGPDERALSNGRPNGEFTSIIGLTSEARDLLDTGRVGVEGGTAIAGAIRETEPIAAAIELPDGTLGLSMTVRVTSLDDEEAIAMRLRALVEDENGHQSLIDLGAAPMDGKDHDLRGYLPTGQAENGLRLAAIQATAFPADPSFSEPVSNTDAELLLRDLKSIGTPDKGDPAGTYPAQAIEIPEKTTWSTTDTGFGSSNAAKSSVPSGWQLGLDITIPRSLQSELASYSAVTWPVVVEIPAVLSQRAANAIEGGVGDRLTLVVHGVAIGIRVVEVTPAVPGGGTSAVIGPLGAIGRDADRTVVVDEVQLSRALFQAGLVDGLVGEWWMDQPDDVEAYLRYLTVQYDGLHAQSAELLARQMQQDPLRVATQGALWLVVIGAGVLAAFGFAVHATGSLRSRATEFAQLRAVGLSRRRLIGVIGIESLLLCGLGVIFGLGLGVLLAYLVGPLVGVSGDGSIPRPSVQVQIPGGQIALLALELSAVLALVVLFAARMQRVAEPASALRRGEER